MACITQKPGKGHLFALRCCIDGDELENCLSVRAIRYPSFPSIRLTRRAQWLNSCDVRLLRSQRPRNRPPPSPYAELPANNGPKLEVLDEGIP